MSENTTDSKVKFGLAGVYIPSELIFNPNLTNTEKILFGFISNLSKTENGCTASNRYLGNMLCVTPQTISDSIRNLKENHYLIVKFSSKNKGTQEQQRHIYVDENYTKTYRSLVEYVHGVFVTKSIPINDFLNGGTSQILGGGLKTRNNTNIDTEEINKELIISSSKEEEWTREASQPSSSQESKWRKVNNISTQTNNKHLDKPHTQRLPDNNSPVTLKKESKALRKCSSYENDSAPVEIIDKWESLGFPKVDAKYRLSTLSKIEDLMRGDFFEDKLLENGNSKYSHRPFTKDEILSAIENRARGAFDFNYAPTTKKSKQSMSKLPMSVWIYNSNGGVSYFLKDFEKPYKKIPEKLRLIDDEYPDYTESIIEKYTEEILYNVAPKEWSIKDLNSFRKSAQRLREYFVDIEDRSRHIRLHEIERQIDVLIRALREHYGQDEEDEGAKIHPTNLCSDFTFNRILPNYMGRQRMLSGKNLIG